MHCSQPKHWIATVACVAAVAGPAAADFTVVQKPLTRLFPLSYCPFETRDVDPGQGAFGLFFTAPTTSVTLHIEIANLDSTGSFRGQSIDNIAVVTRAQFEANRGVSPGFGGCYVDTLPGFPNTGQDAPAFFLNRFAPGTLPFVDVFDTDPAGDPSRPWDLTQGAFFLAQGDSTDCQGLSPKPSSAPRNPEQGDDCTGGALALGQASDGDVIIRTSIPITGLVPNTEYIVTGWWDTNDFLLDNALTITIIAPGSPPPPGGRVLIALDDVDQTSGVDRLVRIPDPATGVGVLVGSLGDNFLDTESIAVLPGTGGADRIFAADNGRLLEIDPATGDGTVIGPIGFDDVDGLAFHPQTRVLYGVTYGSNLLLQIDVATGAGSVVATNVAAGSRLEDLAFHPDGRAFLLVGSTPRVHRIDLVTGAKLQSWTLTGGTSLESLAWSPDGTTLYSAADRAGFKDLVRIDLATSSIAFVAAQPSGFPDLEGLAWVSQPVAKLLASWNSTTDAPLPAARLRLAAVPNPFNPSTQIEFELLASGAVRLDLLDVAGRLVRTLVDEPLGAGRHARLWDGRDAQGRGVASGVYVAHLRQGGAQAVQRLVLVR